MDVTAHIPVPGDGVEERLRKVLRMGRCETHALDARHVRDLPDEIGETERPETVRIDVLAEERDLFVARRDERLHFCENSLRIAAPLAAPCEGNDAERAHVVASAHHREPRVHAAASKRIDTRIRLGARQLEGAEFAAGDPLFGDQVGELAVAVGAGDEIDLVVGVEELILQILRHAPEYPDGHAVGLSP